MVAGEVLIHLELDFVGVLRLTLRDLVKVAGEVGHRDVLVENALGSGVDAGSGNDPARERLPREGVLRLHLRSGKVAAALQLGRDDGPVPELLLPLAQPGIATEKESAILDEGTAKRAAELVAPQWRLALGVPRFGVQRIVTKEFEGRAVEDVRSALGDHVDHAARETPELRAVAIGDDAELLHGIRIRRRVTGAAQSGGVVAAVEKVVHRSRAAVRT